MQIGMLAAVPRPFTVPCGACEPAAMGRQGGASGKPASGGDGVDLDVLLGELQGQGAREAHFCRLGGGIGDQGSVAGERIDRRRVDDGAALAEMGEGGANDVEIAVDVHVHMALPDVLPEGKSRKNS